MDFHRLLEKRETAALIIGLVTLFVIFSPSPLFALATAVLSYILAWEVEKFSQTKFLSYFSPLVLLFSVDNTFLGIFLAFLISFGVAYFELKLTGVYKFHTLSKFFTFLLYTGWLPSALILLKKESSLLLLALILSVWANDTLAYYVGKYFGKKPFFKEISPNKTWEGFWGGVLGGTSVGILASIFFGLEVPIYVWFIVSITAVFGDLFESFIKRSFGIKDSSNLLGSHGGFLDRFDALLFASFTLTIFVS